MYCLELELSTLLCFALFSLTLCNVIIWGPPPAAHSQNGRECLSLTDSNFMFEQLFGCETSWVDSLYSSERKLQFLLKLFIAMHGGLGERSDPNNSCLI